ncbi:MAG: HNH endonuclease, partial [Nitrospinota bacterium]
MKLGNFLSIDPEYEGVGLSRGSKLDQEVWDELAGDLERLRKVAEAIRQSVRSVIGEGSAAYKVRRWEGVEEEFPEGRILTILHVRRERN